MSLLGDLEQRPGAVGLWEPGISTEQDEEIRVSSALPVLGFLLDLSCGGC